MPSIAERIPAGIEFCEREFVPDYKFCDDADWWKQEPIRYVGRSPGEALSFEQEFNSRAERWEKESAIHSSPGAKFMHPDMMYVLTRGEVVIPLILKRLENSGSDWFWALEQFAQRDVAKDATDFESAVEAWMEWGRAMQHIK